MEEWTIGEAAARFGLAPSALRHFEDLGLLAPRRVAGARRYDREQLRRLAFVAIGREHGFPLRATREVLDGDEHRWRELVSRQLTELGEQAERLRRAQQLLHHALDCPAAHPIAECPTLVGALDDLIDGSRR